jgi:ABC-2 type transport system permease protein
MLGTIKINTINELEKMTAKRGLKIYFILIALFPFLLLLAADHIQNDMLVMPTIHLSFAMLKGMVFLLLPIYVFITASDLFSAEHEKGTLFSVRPIDRMELYLSKMIAVVFMVALQLLLFFTAIALSLILFAEAFLLSDLVSVFLSTFISLFPLIVMIVLASFIAQFFRSSSTSVGVSIFIYLMMFVLPFVIPSTLYLFPTTYLDWYQLWTENVSVQWIFQSSLYLFSFSTLFFASGYYMFKKKDVIA